MFLHTKMCSPSLLFRDEKHINVICYNTIFCTVVQAFCPQTVYKTGKIRVCGAMKSPVGTLSNGTVLRQQDGGTKSRQVPIWQKSNLTLEEAAAYSGIGINKLRSMTDSDECKFVLWNGTKRLIKRRKLDEYLDKAFSI